MKGGLGVGGVDAFDVLGGKFDRLVGPEQREQDGDPFLRRREAEDLAFGAGEDAADDADLGPDLQLFVQRGEDRVRPEREQFIDDLLVDRDR